MTKSKKPTKRKIIFNSVPILWLVIFTVIVVQAASIWHITKLQQSVESTSGLSMQYLLKNGEELRYKYPVIDVSEERVYLPEARIYLPLNEASRNLRYEYKSSSKNQSSNVIYFSNSSVVGQQKDEKYASCDKMVTLLHPEANYKDQKSYKAEISQTKDGLRDVYINTDMSCWDGAWYTDVKQALVDTVIQAKNY